MEPIKSLFSKNQAWAASMKAREPAFFDRLSRQQNPDYLWIGCADSRVPANEIVGLLPGEMFVHRNVANVVVHTDLNCLAVLQYAIDVLRVDHVIVCGHYGCGGVAAATESRPLGLIDNWLRHVQDVADHHQALLAKCRSDAERNDRLCALNVLEQATNVCRTTVVQDAWRRGQRVTVHGWIYRLQDGILRDVGFSALSSAEAAKSYKEAVARLETALP